MKANVEFTKCPNLKGAMVTIVGILKIYFYLNFLNSKIYEIIL